MGACGTRSDKQIERKILHVYMDLYFFSFFSNPALFENPRGCLHEVPIYTSKHGGSRTSAHGTRSDK